MILYGRATHYPVYTDPTLGPRWVSLWRTTNADSYLRLANPDTDCPPDPTTLVLDDGVTEPNRYAFYRVNRNPSRRSGDPARLWLIKGRAETTYPISWFDGSSRWCEFQPSLYVGRTNNPTDNDFRDGDTDAPNDGSSVNIDPSSLDAVSNSDFVPASNETISWYYATALVQAFGSNGYRAGIACIVGVSSIDLPVSVQWYYVLFQNRQCIAAAPAIGFSGWNGSWIRMAQVGSTVQVQVDGSVMLSHPSTLGNWTTYRLIQMETVLSNLSNGNPIGNWSYLGGQLWTNYVPVARVAGVRSAYTQYSVWLSVSDNTQQRIRVRTMRSPTDAVPAVQFRSGSNTYDAEHHVNGYYRPAGNPLGTNWEARYDVFSTWTQPTLLELTEAEQSAAEPFIVAEWVSSSSGVMGSIAQTRFRAGNSSAPVQVYLRRGVVEALLYTFNAPGSGWNESVWNPFDWLRVPPRGAFELVYRLGSQAEAVLSGTVTANPQVSLVWLSSSSRRVGLPFTVRATASGSDQNLVIETIQNGNTVVRATYPVPSRGYWDNDTRDTTWLATLPYGEFTVRARLEEAQASLTGTVLAPSIEAQWVSNSTVPLGATMQVRARVYNATAPLEFYVRRKKNETLVASYNAPSGGWDGEWRNASWIASLPTGLMEWVIRCGELETVLIGWVYDPNPPAEQKYAKRFSVKMPFPHNYWVIRSVSGVVSTRTLPRRLVRLGAGWGFPNTDQGRMLEIDTWFDTSGR